MFVMATATTHAKAFTATTAATAAMIAAVFSSGDYVTIIVCFVTVGGAVFGSIMSNRARRYELDLEREETEIERLRRDAIDLRTRNETLDDRCDALEKRNINLWVRARLFEGQLIDAGITPANPLTEDT